MAEIIQNFQVVQKQQGSIISFKPELRSSLEKSKTDNTTVALVDCQVREGKFDAGIHKGKCLTDN